MNTSVICTAEREREIKWEIWREMEEWRRNACRRLPRPESYTYFQIRFLKKLIHVEVTAQQWNRPSPHIVFEETWKHHLKARINLARDIAHFTKYQPYTCIHDEMVHCFQKVLVRGKMFAHEFAIGKLPLHMEILVNFARKSFRIQITVNFVFALICSL